MELKQKKNINENKRISKNILILMVMYFLIGAIKGLNGDVLMSYIHLNTPSVSTGLTIYIGISMLLLVIALIATKKVGYKKVLLTLTVLIAVSIFGILNTKNAGLATLFIIIIELGHKAFLAIIPIVLMAYVDKKKRVKTFSKAIFLNVLGVTIATFFDGKLVVLKFKELLGLSYQNASILTTKVKTLSTMQFNAYLSSYKFVIWISCILAIILFFLILFTKEEKLDYKNTVVDLEKVMNKDTFKAFKSKYIIVWILFICLLNIDDNLVGPHIPVYLNRVLGISRGTTSTLISLESIGMMLFVITAPWVIKKMGRIKHFSIFLFLSVPLMLLMGFGGIFGSYVTTAMGVIMFIRWGVTHSYHPTMSILPLTFVSKENRPILSAVITLIAGIFSIIVGIFGKMYLFKSINGYHEMFYIIAVVYTIAAILIFLTYHKEYDNFEEEL